MKVKKMLNKKRILVSLTTMIMLGSAHLAQAEQMVMPTINAHGSTLALVLCGVVALIKARRDMSR
jgi:hypothetical protein